jgi:heme exporter protein A
VRDNLAFWSTWFGGADGQIDSALAALALDNLTDLPAAYLSAGQRRRLALARLVAVHRPIWLLDEPTAALDVTAQAALAQLMRDHLSGGGLIVAATHGPIGLDAARELRIGAPVDAAAEAAEVSA